MTDQLLQLLVSQAWQIAVLAGMVMMANRTLAKNRPHLAHALWMLVLIKCVTPPIWGPFAGRLQSIADNVGIGRATHKFRFDAA